MPVFFQNFIYNRKLHREFQLREPIRKKHLTRFSEMKSCLVLFDASDEQNCMIMFSIIKELQDKDKNIRAVGYVPWKNNPHYCFPKLSFDYLNTKGISFAGIPKADFIQDILTLRFDLLLDFTKSVIPGMMYISALTNAGMKIARNRTEDEFFTNVYDFIIDQDGLNERQYFDEIRKYLLQLNNGKE